MRIHQLPLWQRTVCSGALAAVAVAAVVVGVRGEGVLRVAALVAAVVLAVLAVRVRQLRVETGADVVVVNWARTHRLPWTEVERFAVGAGGVVLRRTGGATTAVHAFPAVAGLTRSAELRLDLAAEGLERARRRHAEGTRPGAPRSV